MKKVTFLFLLIPFIMFSQIKISGQVKDSLGFLEFTNVALLDLSDKLITGTITNRNGEFEISVPTGSYYISITYLGYKSWRKKIELKKDTNLGTIILENDSNILAAVTLTAEKPLIIRKVDRLVFNVANSTISSGNTWDIIKKTPGVISLSSGDLQILGKEGVRVMINDKIVQLAPQDVKNMLEGMSGDTVESIEVITIPPSEYDAGSSGLLNIKLKKNTSLGLKGNVNSNLELAIYPKFSNGVFLYFKNKKLDLSFNYSLSKGIRFSVNDNQINFLDENTGTTFSIWDEYTQNKTFFINNTWGTSISYNISNSFKAIFELSTNYKPNVDTETSSTTLVSNPQRQIDSIFRNRNLSQGNISNYVYSLSLQKDFKKQNHYIRFILANIDYLNESSQTINTDFFNAADEFQRQESFALSNDQDIKLTSYSIDYSLPLDSITTITVGAKLTDSRSKNDLGFFNFINQIPVQDDPLSDTFIYDENIYAWYTSISSSWKKLYFKAGLRQEITDTDGISMSTINSVSNYFNILFPSLYLQYSINNNHTLSFAYGKRIQRPTYWHLNPFRKFNSPFSFFEGNPFLQPSISNDYEVSYSLKSKHFFTFFFKKTNKPFTQLALQDNNEEFIRYTVVNLDDELSYGLSYSTSEKINKWWTTYISLNAYYKESNFVNPTNQEFVVNKNWNFDPFFGNEFTISKKHNIYLENINQFFSPKVQGGFDIDSRLNVTLGINKKLFNNKATAIIYVEDIFNANIFDLNSTYSNQQNASLVKNENRFIRFSFRYNFGSNKIKTRRIKIDQLQELNRIE
jgi:hypothetical protein